MVLLGAYPLLTLGEARAAAREALTALLAGEHPRILVEAKRRAADAAAANTFAAVAARFVDLYVPTIKSGKLYTDRIRRELIPAFGERPIAELRRRDVIALLEDIAARSGKGAARGTLAVLSKLFNWAVARDIVESNPAASVKPDDILGKAKARDRLLADQELAAIWNAVDAVGEPFASVYRLLLLTGARYREVSDAAWADFDEAAATLTVPAGRAKGGDAMLIPLPPTAVALIAAMPRFSGPSLLHHLRSGAISSFSQAKARLDAALGGAVAPFVIHDFRRAVRSGLGRLAVPPVVAELVIGHQQRGIVGVYDRYSYLDEKRSALGRWEKRLLGIVVPEPAAPNSCRCGRGWGRERVGRAGMATAARASPEAARANRRPRPGILDHRP